MNEKLTHKAVVAVFAWVALGAPAQAQDPPTSYTLRVYAQGAASPLTTLDVPIIGISCDQPDTPPPAETPTNPKKWAWDDPDRVGRDCVYLDGARFDALPDGDYDATIIAVNAAGASTEHPRVPFVRRRPQPPAAPMGLRIFP